MLSFLRPTDVLPLHPGLTAEVATLLISDVEAQAIGAAPCLAAVAEDVASPAHAQVVSILRQAVLRWARAGDGGITTEQKTADVFSHSVTFDSRTRGEGRLLEGERRQLREICRNLAGGGRRRQAFTVMPR